MGELFAYLDIHGLSINFSRVAEGRDPWYAAVLDLKYETPTGNVTSVAAFGGTLEEACEACLAEIRAHEVFKVVRDTTERRVPLKRLEVSAHA